MLGLSLHNLSGSLVDVGRHLNQKNVLIVLTIFMKQKY